MKGFGRSMSGQIANFPRRQRLRRLLRVSLLALAFTLLDAAKPLHIDDTAYVVLAHHIAAHPRDPYGGTIFWYSRPDPANEILAPPVLPYWLALGIRLFGEHPLAWKLWLFPFALLFVAALDALFGYFCAGLETPLLCLTVLSPVFLPSLNLMLDVPALALSLAAIVLFLQAGAAGSWKRAVAAGLIAGLAMETKYTAFLAPATMLLAVLTAPWGGRLRTWRSLARDALYWLIAAGCAAGIFVAWEWAIARAYGTSHFIYHYHTDNDPFLDRASLAAGALLPLLGGVTPILAALGLAALGVRWRWVIGTVAMIFLGYGVVALADGSVSISLNHELLPFLPETMSWTLAQIGFGAWGLIVCLILVWVAGRLVFHWPLPRRETDTTPAHRPGWKARVRRAAHLARIETLGWRRHRPAWFLVLWFGLEVAGYFALSPFMAARRAMGMVITATLLIGALAALRSRHTDRRLVAAVVVAGVVLGVAFAAIDLREAQARRDVAVAAERYVHEQAPEARIWYAGHWGFQYYAERLGMKPVISGETELQPGDWLVVPDDSIHHQKLDIDETALRNDVDIVCRDGLPWQTVWSFYGTTIGVPLEHHDGTRVRLHVYKVVRACVP